MKNMTNALTKYHNELQAIDKELATLPEGTLIKKQAYYYHAVKNKQISITKDISFIKQLARKKYLLTRCIQLRNNLHATSPNQMDIHTPIQLIATLPKAYQSLPIDYFYHPEIASWQTKKPCKNNLYPENEKYVYNSIAYRSMSERQIAEILDKNSLPFQYDYTFDMGVAHISPDFVIKNPFTNGTFLLEFFGAFYKSTYGKAMNDKLDNYAEVGYTANENLIILFEYHLRKLQRIQDILDTIVL